MKPQDLSVLADIWIRDLEKKRFEKKVNKLADEIAELVFWGITFGRSNKSVKVHRKEEERG